MDGTASYYVELSFYHTLALLRALLRYVSLVALFLDSNGIRKIENIAHLTALRQLYLDSNCIERIEGLETLTELQTLNLSAAGSHGGPPLLR